MLTAPFVAKAVVNDVNLDIEEVITKTASKGNRFVSADEVAKQVLDEITREYIEPSMKVLADRADSELIDRLYVTDTGYKHEYRGVISGWVKVRDPVIFKHE